MNRTVIFSHFDIENRIQEYVVHYISELKKYANRIIFVSDCDIKHTELDKINSIVDYSIIGKHGEYDFGSYKRGYNYLTENDFLKECDELIFANDSCYAPLFSFEEIFRTMEEKDLDFWGNTANCSKAFKNIYHIQSYFIAFSPKVLNSESFKNFINSIKKQERKEDIILYYECGFTKCLEDAGYKWDVYCNLSKKYCDSQVLFFKELILENKSPFLKRKIPVLQNKLGKYLFNINKFIALNTDYKLNIEYLQGMSIDFIKYFIKKYILRRHY